MTKSFRAPQITAVGTVAIDITRYFGIGNACRDIRLNFGGVCSNVVSALGLLGVGARFVSTRFIGEMVPAVKAHFASHQIQWVQLPCDTRLAIFQADVDADGEIGSEQFFENGSISGLTAHLFQTNKEIFFPTDALVACTDIATEGIVALQEIARERSVPFWLLSTSIEEIEKVRNLKERPELIALNIGELRALTMTDLEDLHEIAAAAHGFLKGNGACLVTLGFRGSLLCFGNSKDFLYQPVPHLKPQSTIGAGDVLFASLLAARVFSTEWAPSLTTAVGRTINYLMSNGDDFRFQTLSGAPSALPPLKLMSL